MKNKEGKSKAFYQLLIEAGYKSNLSDSLLDFYQEKQGLFFNLLTQAINLDGITDKYPDELKQVYACYKLNKRYDLKFKDREFSNVLDYFDEMPVGKNQKRILMPYTDKRHSNCYTKFIDGNIKYENGQFFVLNDATTDYFNNEYVDQEPRLEWKVVNTHQEVAIDENHQLYSFDTDCRIEVMMYLYYLSYTEKFQKVVQGAPFDIPSEIRKRVTANFGLNTNHKKIELIPGF